MRMKKRIISCILVAAMLLTLIPIPAAAKTSGNLYGDANGDGVIDLKDLLTIRKYLGGQARADKLQLCGCQRGRRGR